MPLFAVILLAGCRNNSDTGQASDGQHITRFEQIIFEQSDIDIQSRLRQTLQKHPDIPLRIRPDDEDYMQLIYGFVADPTVREIYDTVQQLYRDLGWLEKQLFPALQRAHELCPVVNYQNAYTCVLADFDYDSRVVAQDSSLRIALDIYALPSFAKFGYFGLPLFIVNMCNSQQILSDCIIAIAKQHITTPKQPLTLLDYMICEGKALYFADRVLPSVPDSIKIRYTKEQYEWVRGNEQDIWAYFVNNQLLYETDYMRFHNFIDDAPKTNAFKNSAPRTTQYIGWQIVNQYMKRNNCDIADLLKEPDSQKILKLSGYKPNKTFRH
ncbi:MAG: hypothetical protein IJU81_06970 [Bacteroidales bacterium]|nr:hypothetical protein [Bacteroidales bacterium]